MRDITKDTTLCISVAARPSNIGTRFHNHLYEVLGLDFVYKAFRPTDIAATIQGMRGLPIRGCSVSMPFKQAVLDLVDSVEASAEAIGGANTIVNDDGHLTAYNTDVEAVEELLLGAGLDTSARVLVRGSGSMASAVIAAFRTAGFHDVTVIARNEETGSAQAERHGFSWRSDEPQAAGAILANATPLGMAGADEDALSFTESNIAAALAVLDVVAFPSETPLIRAARDAGRPVITGAEVIALQAARQFALYTGVTPTPEQIREASELSRA